MDPALVAEPLLEQPGSVLTLHLTNQHLLIIYAATSVTHAAAVWLDSNSLKPVCQLALPSDVCHAWAEQGLQKALISTSSGGVYTMPAQPQAKVQQAKLVLLVRL